MKRSEIIKLILTKFPDWNDQIQLDFYDVAGLMTIIESAGMLPPISFHKMKHLGENEWEPENESK